MLKKWRGIRGLPGLFEVTSCYGGVFLNKKVSREIYFFDWVFFRSEKWVEVVSAPRYSHAESSESGGKPSNQHASIFRLSCADFRLYFVCKGQLFGFRVSCKS